MPHLSHSRPRTNADQSIRGVAHPSSRWLRGGGAGTLLALGLVGLIVGCGDPPQPAAIERTDSAGVEIVHNTAPDRTLPWTFTVKFSLGGDSLDDLTFFRRSVDADGEGNIYVLDRGSHRVVVFDSAGVFMRTLGREGSGPGELGLPVALAVTSHGQVSVYDVSKHGLVNFAPAGSNMPQEPLRVSYVGGRIARSPTHLGVTVSESDPAQGTTMERVLVLQDSDTVEEVRLVKRAPTPVLLPSCGIHIQDLPPFFQPSLLWRLRDSLVVANTTPEYVVDLIHDGHVSASYRRNLRPLEATLDLAIAEAGDGLRLGGIHCEGRDIAEQVGYAPVIPVIADIQVAPDGSIWVKRSAHPEDPAQTDILTEDGEYLGTLPPGSPFPAGFLNDDKVIVEEVDDLGVELVVVYTISRG